jgi:hypothetical protein
MEYLKIENSNYIAIRRGIGAFLILTAILWVVLFTRNTSKIIYLISSGFFLFSGIYQMTNGLGLERAWFRSGENFLIVKWTNKINPIQIHDSRISKIHLTKFNVQIFQKSTKPLKLDTGFLEKNQRNVVYAFLSEYAKKKNLELVRDSGV